jgi:hypothetical protein
MNVERVNTEGADEPHFYTNGLIDQTMLKQGFFGNS